MERNTLTEYRSDERLPPQDELYIKYQLVELDGREKLHASRVADVSCRGAKFTSSEPLPVGQMLVIDLISPPSQTRYHLMGQVRWCLEVDEIPTYHAGIHFVEDSSEDFAKWLKNCVV